MFGTGVRHDMSEIRALAQATNTLATTTATQLVEHVKFCTNQERENDKRHEENKKNLETVASSLSELQKVLARIAWKFFWGVLTMVVVTVGSILSHAFNFHLSLQ